MCQGSSWATYSRSSRVRESSIDFLRSFAVRPNGPGIELPAARDLTMDRPTAARACRLPMRAAGGWSAWQAPVWRPVSSNALLDGAAHSANVDIEEAKDGNS